jgi:hypothetical protein
MPPGVGQDLETDAVGSGVNKANDILRAMIEQHPYTTAAVALGLGILIDRFSSRDY